MKLSMFALLTCALIFGTFCPASSGDVYIDFKTKARTLSVNFKDVPLKDILDKLKKKTGIWVKGSESLLGGNISAKFDNMPLQDSLKRILSSINYSLVFGSNDKLEGVVIIGKGKSRPTTARSTAVSKQRSVSSSSKSTGSSKVGSRGYNKSGLEKPSATSHSTPKMTTQEKEVFQVTKSSTPPGGKVNPTPEQLEKFKVKKNVGPPGGPVTVTQEELEKFKVRKNVGPPGGPVTVTPEELEKFKVIKKAAPPGS